MTTWRAGDSVPLSAAQLEARLAAVTHASQHAPGGTDELIRYEDVKRHGAVGNGVADDTTAISNAIAAARTHGVNTVFFPAGTYKITSPLNAYSGMRYIGSGIGVSVLKFSSAGSLRGFVDGEGATQGAPMTDVSWSDFTIDGSGVGGTASKAFFVQNMLRARWTNVRATQWPATGFGCDFLQDSVFVGCVADNNGRLLNVDDAGASGFGIGTGSYAVESVAVIGCRAYSNKNFGIFFEQQNTANGGSPFFSKGCRVVGCHASGNNYGIGDCGVDGVVVTGCSIEDNTQDGFTVSQGTGGGIGAPGTAGLVADNVIRGNGRYGVFVDYRFKASNSAASRYVIRGNLIAASGVSGVALSTDTITIKDLAVVDNLIVGCGANGIQTAVLSSGAWQDLTIERNKCASNGQTNVAGATQGVRIDGNTTRLRVRWNDCYDNGSPQKQTYGLKFGSSTHTDVMVSENDFRNNLTSGADLTGGTFAGLPVFRNNRGLNPKGAVTAPGVPASGSDYTNVTGYDCMVEITGGTVTVVAIGTGGGTSTGRTSGMFRVPAGQTIRLTYSVAPSWTWFGD